LLKPEPALTPKAEQERASRELPDVVKGSHLHWWKKTAIPTQDIPTITQAPPQTPVAAVWENGVLTKSAWGTQGRCLAADALGLSSEDLNDRVVAKVPKFTPPTRRGS
jgi:hypothetical protein